MLALVFFTAGMAVGSALTFAAVFDVITRGSVNTEAAPSTEHERAGARRSADA